MQLALAMTEVGIECCVYQPGDLAAVAVVNGIEVRTRPVQHRRLWSSLAQVALSDGWQYLHFKYLEHVPSGLPRGRVTSTQHGVHWDIPYEAHGKPWYAGGAAARGYLPGWRRWQMAKSFAGLRRCTAVSAMDTSFLRVTQALRPGLRRRIFITGPFCDLFVPSPGAGASASVPSELSKQIAATRAAGGIVVLVPRNLSLVRGESWLPDIAARVAARRSALFVVTGIFLGRLDHSWRSARLSTGGGAATHSVEGHAVSVIHLGGYPHDLMPALYQAADIVLIPSFSHEGASLAAAEAMFFGRPVVATNVGGLNDTLDDGWTGVITRPDPASVAAGVLRLAANATDRSTLATNAHLKATACFSLDHWRRSQRPFFAAAGWVAPQACP